MQTIIKGLFLFTTLCNSAQKSDSVTISGSKGDVYSKAMQGRNKVLEVPGFAIRLQDANSADININSNLDIQTSVKLYGDNRTSLLIYCTDNIAKISFIDTRFDCDPKFFNGRINYQDRRNNLQWRLYKPKYHLWKERGS